MLGFRDQLTPLFMFTNQLVPEVGVKQEGKFFALVSNVTCRHKHIGTNVHSLKKRHLMSTEG
jgi:hypothetical protein